MHNSIGQEPPPSYESLFASLPAVEPPPPPSYESVINNTDHTNQVNKVSRETQTVKKKEQKRKHYKAGTKLKYIQLAEQKGNNYVVKTKGISKSLISKWRKEKDKYVKAKEDRKSAKMVLKNNSTSSVFSQEQEREIYNEIQKLREGMIPVNGAEVKRIALQVALDHGITNFKASNGFLTRFQHRWNLTRFQAHDHVSK